VAQDAILGREEELAAIAHFFDDDRSGPRAFLLEGEAGIGKTTVWREGLRLAQGRGIALVSQASEAETRLSFSVLGDLLAPALDGALETLPTGQRGALEAALLLGPPARSRPDARAVSLAVLGVLRSLASERPVTIAIDDVQWIDAPSARALAFALRRLDDQPVAVVATRRISPGLEDPLDLAGLPSGLDRLTVGPIPPVTLGRLLRQRLGFPFAPPLVKRIHEVSGGNPFFAVEIGWALGPEKPNPRLGEPLPLPLDLHELLRQRLSAVSGPARRVLLIAAASAVPTPALVEDAGGARSGLDEAEEAGIVELRGGQIRFTHPLLASAVYTGATSRARRDSHARLARIATHPEERARHLALSINGPDAEVATALEQAALHAEARGAPSAAAELYQLAVTITPAEEIDRLLRRRQRAAGNLYAAGDVSGARELVEQLLIALGHDPGTSSTLYLLASMSWNDVPRITKLLMRALDEVGDDDAVRARILADLSWVALARCDPVSSVRWGDAALELAPDPAGLRFALSARAMAGCVLGHDTTDLLERGIAAEGALAVAELATPRICLGWQQMWAGALDTVRDTLEVELARYLDQGHETASWEVKTVLGEVEFRAGYWERAIHYAREAREIAVDAGWFDVFGQILPMKASIECATGETHEARVDGIEGLSVCERTGDRWNEIRARSALGFLELSLGDYAACHAWLDPLVERTEDMGLREPGAFPFVPDEVEALVSLGKLDAAVELTERLEDQGLKLNRPLAIATAARCRGLIAGARRDLAAADEHLERSLRLHVSVQQPFELGRTRLVAGSVQRRMRRQRRARDLLGEALGVFEELGAPLWAAKARSELAGIGGRPPAPAALTATEEQVARLVAEGRTNREVAETLVMSVHTVDAHLRRIYRKLQVRSRTELSHRL